MIAYLRGNVAGVDASGAIIDVGGVGYELSMSTKAIASLPAVGTAAQVWTYMQVKEDGVSLFGFSDLAEKAMFERLIGVSGIGPKMAIAALSTYSAAELSSVIAQGDVTSITHVPGIGKKTAQRVVLELQGILKSDAVEVLPVQNNAALSDASQALEAMGFSSDEVARALKDVAHEGKDASALVRLALRNMGGR